MAYWNMQVKVQFEKVTEEDEDDEYDYLSIEEKTNDTLRYHGKSKIMTP